MERTSKISAVSLAGFLMDVNKNRCWCRTRHKGAHLCGVAVRDTNREAPGEMNCCGGLQGFKCLMLAPKDTRMSLKSAVMHEMTKKIYVLSLERE